MRVFEERPYQENGLDQIRTIWRKGPSGIILQVPTGGGKTHMFSKIMTGSKVRCLMAVHGRDLVKNASDRLTEEEVDHGVIMPGHWRNKRGSRRIQIGSIDTIGRREAYPDAKIVIIDEAHFGNSPTFRKFVQHYRDAGSYILGVTATPFTKKSLYHIGQRVVKPTTLQNLIDDGYLVGPRYFIPEIPDLAGVKTEKGDYNQAQLAEIMDSDEIIGNIPEKWKMLAQGRATLCFAVTVKNSKDIVAEFKAQGIPAVHVDAYSTQEEREEALWGLRTGVYKVVSNVNIFATGKDIPFLGCIIMARPTKSLILYLQQAGRGTRTFDGDEYVEPKKDFLLLDHAGNIFRHNKITNEHDANIDPDPKKSRKYDPSAALKRCNICYELIEGSFCENCGPQGGGGGISEYRSRDGNLKEIEPEPIEVRTLRELKIIKRRDKKSTFWLRREMLHKFGPKVAEEMVPRMTQVQKMAMERQRGGKLISSMNEFFKK